MNDILAFDIGGTNIKYGIISPKGAIVERHQIPTEAGRGGAALLERIAVTAENMLSGHKKIYGIAVSSAGQISPATGDVIYATGNIPGWTGIPLGSYLKERLGLPVYVENDVNAAALGEQWQGAGRGSRDFLCITVGTGIGGAIVTEGKIYHGLRGAAGELGHILFEKDGRICTCGRRGCFEQYGSMGALVNYVIERGKKDFIYPGIDGIMIIEEAKKGNGLCAEAVEWLCGNLAAGIASLVHIFNPSLVILGGGFSEENHEIIEQIRNRVRSCIMPSFQEGFDLLPARCGNSSGMLGAAYGLITLGENCRR